jgi:hypothetical protein
MGSNKSVDENLAPLKYADDDAARYFDLFRLLGARTYLLSRLDANTQRLHPQAAAEADEPKRAVFDRAAADLARDVEQASARGLSTVVYVVYAGHGDVRNGQGYITLEDARITGGELAQVVRRIPATHVHVVVDACASYFLAMSRGPGGERRPIEGFHASALTEDPRVGVLLSTSSARESHEWEGFEAGVFSHEVRSGLYGAADADGDGEVSYREIAAFVTRANAAIPADRFRPDVYAQPPKGTAVLMDIHAALKRRLVIDGAHAGHYYIEDAHGVRIADAHNAPGQTLSLVRPGPGSPLFLRSASDEREFPLEPEPEVLALADLPQGESRVRRRGAAHESFGLVFSLPFSNDVVASYTESSLPVLPVEPEHDKSAVGAGGNAHLRRRLGVASMGVAALGIGAGTILAISASSQAKGSSPTESQQDTSARNDRINTLNVASVASFAAGGAFVATGIVLLIWPDAPRNVQVSTSPLGAGASWTGAF